jgi:hypothetical protein
LLLRVKAVDPEHPAILNEAALHELRSGNAVAARELLERAVARDICSRCCRKRRCWNRKERYAPLPRCITTLCRRYAPTAFFSILDSKSHIPAHTGTTNTRVIVHVPLVIPPACRFRVGSTTREWRPGAAWVFDDTIEHEAWNDSDLPRAILIFDVWNPYLTAAERDFVRTMVTGIARYYGDPAPFVEQH